MNFKTLIPALLVAATVSGFGVMSSTNTAQATSTATTAAVAEIGKAAPAFSLMDTDGKKVSLADFKGKTVVLVGDLKHGRTVHSLAKMLAAFDVALVFVAPPELAMPAGVAAAVDAGTATRAEAPSLAAALVDADALYVTRVQKERFASQEDYLKAKGSYTVDPACVVPLFACFLVVDCDGSARSPHTSCSLPCSTLCLAGRWPAPSRRAW